MRTQGMSPFFSLRRHLFSESNTETLLTNFDGLFIRVTLKLCDKTLFTWVAKSETSFTDGSCSKLKAFMFSKIVEVFSDIQNNLLNNLLMKNVGYFFTRVLVGFKHTIR